MGFQTSFTLSQYVLTSNGSQTQNELNELKNGNTSNPKNASQLLCSKIQAELVLTSSLSLNSRKGPCSKKGTSPHSHPQTYTNAHKRTETSTKVLPKHRETCQQ